MTAASAFMTAAGMSAFMIMMMAFRIRIIGQISFKEGSHLCIRISAGAGIQTDARFCQRIFRAGPDTAADEHIHIKSFQKAYQSAMAASIGIYHL